MPSPSPEAKELPDIWDKGQFVELLNKAACTMLGTHPPVCPDARMCTAWEV